MNKEFAKKILEMRKVDQNLRFAAIKAQKNSPELTPYNYLVYLADVVHNLQIRSMVAQHGYPTKRTVGVRALKAFWLLIQHQDSDLDLQKSCLERCEFEPRERAYLTDRVRIAEGKKQIFGTQFTTKKGGGVKPFPIEDSKNLERRRKQHDLPPFSEYEKKMRETNAHLLPRRKLN